MSEDEAHTRIWYNEKRKELKLRDMKTGEERVLTGITKDTADALLFELSYQGNLRAVS